MTTNDYIGESQAALNKAIDYLDSAMRRAQDYTPDRSEAIEEELQELRTIEERVAALADFEVVEPPYDPGAEHYVRR